MMNFGALNLFDSCIKKFKKTLDCINHVIYTHAIVYTAIQSVIYINIILD